MATAVQPNTALFTYVDDSGGTWNKRGELETAVNAIDGSTPFTPAAPVFPAASRRYHVRYAVFQDTTTFRTKKIVVYTAAAFASITGASTLAVTIQGQTAAVTYNLSQKIGEKQPVAKASRNLADHP